MDKNTLTTKIQACFKFPRDLLSFCGAHYFSYQEFGSELFLYARPPLDSLNLSAIDRRHS